MAKTNPKVDAYILKAQPFAQPILNHLRKLVHQACPDVEETIKWGFSAFDYKGPFCTMAAFKQHCAFGFWKAALMKDADKLVGRVLAAAQAAVDAEMAAGRPAATKALATKLSIRSAGMRATVSGGVSCGVCCGVCCSMGVMFREGPRGPA